MADLNVNGDYEIVIYNGTISKTIKGTLIASLNYKELRFYGKSAAQLYTAHHPLLPKGTPFDATSGVWHVIQPFVSGQPLSFVYSGWIKENGVTDITLREINISGTFKSGRSLLALHNAFIKENVLDLALRLVKGQEGNVVTDPKIGIQYVMQLADSSKSKLWGTYKATVAYDLLPSMNLSGKMEYERFTWDTSHITELESYRWMVFDSTYDPGKRFAVPVELLSNPLSEVVNQGHFEFNKVGTLDDVPHIRSVLNIQSCTDIEIGTNS